MKKKQRKICIGSIGYRSIVFASIFTINFKLKQICLPIFIAFFFCFVCLFNKFVFSTYCNTKKQNSIYLNTILGKYSVLLRYSLLDFQYREYMKFLNLMYTYIHTYIHIVMDNKTYGYLKCIFIIGSQGN